MSKKPQFEVERERVEKEEKERATRESKKFFKYVFLLLGALYLGCIAIDLAFDGYVSAGVIRLMAWVTVGASAMWIGLHIWASKEVDKYLNEPDTNRGKQHAFAMSDSVGSKTWVFIVLGIAGLFVATTWGV